MKLASSIVFCNVNYYQIEYYSGQGYFWKYIDLGTSNSVHSSDFYLKINTTYIGWDGFNIIHFDSVDIMKNEFYVKDYTGTMKTFNLNAYGIMEQAVPTLAGIPTRPGAVPYTPTVASSAMYSYKIQHVDDNVNKKCECGSEKTYGPETRHHSDWCEKFEK